MSNSCNFIKIETLAQVFFCEFCEISKNTFPYRTRPVAAPVCYWDREHDIISCWLTASVLS